MSLITSLVVATDYTEECRYHLLHFEVNLWPFYFIKDRGYATGRDNKSHFELRGH